MNKIAFFRLNKSGPPANFKVISEFKKQFNNCEIDDIIIKDFFKKRYLLIIINLFFVIKYYGFKYILSKKKLGHYFYLTPYVFSKIKKFSEELIKKNKYIFSFQMQSMFDASHIEVPHFIYTDHTHLANLCYKEFDIKKIVNHERLDLEKSIYKNANIIFTRSKHVTESLINQYEIPGNKIKCVYAGYNSAVAERKLSNKKYDNKNILFVGIDWKRKGGPDLLTAFLKVLQYHKDAKLTIVGTAEIMKHPSINFKGIVPLNEIGDYYFNASIFCLPTKLEPFGIAFLEAMSYKLPVIGTNIGAIPDFIEHGKNGYLTETGNTEQMAKYMINLLDDPEKCRKFGEYGYCKIKNIYNWETVVSKIKNNILK